MSAELYFFPLPLVQGERILIVRFIEREWGFGRWRRQGGFYWQVGSSPFHFLLQSDKPWQRVHYSRTQICDTFHPPPANQVPKSLAKRAKQKLRVGAVCLPHTPCLASSAVSPSSAPGAFSSLDRSPWLTQTFLGVRDRQSPEGLEVWASHWSKSSGHSTFLQVGITRSRSLLLCHRPFRGEVKKLYSNLMWCLHLRR